MLSRMESARRNLPELDLLDLVGAELDRLRIAPAIQPREVATNVPPMLGVLLLHLDGLSDWRDRRGEGAANALLLLVGARLAAQLRVGDRCFGPAAASMGTSEVSGGGCLLSDVPHAHTVRTVAERLRRHLGSPWRIGPARLTLRASIGMAVGPAGDLMRLLDEARQALHGACKQPGGLQPFRRPGPDIGI